MADRDYSTSDQVGTYTTANDILGPKIPIQIGHASECIVKTLCLNPGNADPKPLERYPSDYECPAEKYIKKKTSYRIKLYGRVIVTDPDKQLPKDSYLNSFGLFYWKGFLNTYPGSEMNKFTNRNHWTFYKYN